MLLPLSTLTPILWESVSLSLFDTLRCIDPFAGCGFSAVEDPSLDQVGGYYVEFDDMIYGE